MLDDIKKTLCATADKLRANIDARKQASMISRVQSELTDEVIARIANTAAAWSGEKPVNPEQNPPRSP